MIKNRYSQKFQALRTLILFVFDKNRKLIYTGRGVDSPRNVAKMMVNDLENALAEHLAEKASLLQ